jgi:hypothetical protein
MVIVPYSRLCIHTKELMPVLWLFNYETHLCISLHVLISGEELLSLSLASSVSSESGLSELEGSLQGSGSSDLDELNDASLVWSETSDLLHDLADHGVPGVKIQVERTIHSNILWLNLSCGLLNHSIENSFKFSLSIRLL